MEKINDNINRFLPFGESLRVILQHPSITTHDIQRLLNLKGIFVESINDEMTFPLLLTNLISPFEFQILKENIQSREDREKTISRTFDWETNINLLSAIPNNFNIQEIVKATFPRYKVIGTPNFNMIDSNPNLIALDFKCETENYSKEWYRSKNEFKGQITFEKIKDNKVQLQIVHTSPETTEISNKVIKYLENHFKTYNYINPIKEIKKILYSDFTNEGRIAFFLQFTQGNEIFTFEKASYLDISSDPKEILPTEINWLELGKVKELNINGENLHNLPFIKEQKLHKYMELCEMEIIYNFSIPTAEGNCKIKFGFPNYFQKRISSIEFVVDIAKINLKNEFSAAPQSSVRAALLKSFEKMKTAKYEFIISKYLN